MEIGVDCIEITRFNELEKQNKLLSKIFTENEIKYCQNRTNSLQHFAAHFAGKEAVMKAMSPYGVQLSPQQIEILNKDNGAPYATLFCENAAQYVIKISLSHSNEIALAFVIIDKR